MAGLVVLCLRTANHWDAAPVCGSDQAGGRCVTEVHGELAPRSFLRCSTGLYSTECSNLPVDVSFDDGTSRHMDLSQGDRITSVFSGGQRNASVVPRSDAPVIGRFYRGHLVGLVFPETGARLATDDFPGYAVNKAAALGIFTFPWLSALIAGFVTWRVKRRDRRLAGDHGPQLVIATRARDGSSR